MQTTHHKLLLFIVLSLAAHAFWFIQNQSTVRFNSQDGYPLSVQINTPVQPSPSTKHQPTVKPPARQTKNRPVRTDNGSLQSADKLTSNDNPGSSTQHTQSSIAPVQKQAATNNKVSSSTSSPITRAHIVAHINELIAHHFSYPLLARRQGWEGTVLLDFHLSADGGIHNIKVGQSSGHSILDRSAVSTLQKIGYLKLVSNWPGAMSTNIQLPIIYRLQEG